MVRRMLWALATTLAIMTSAVGSAAAVPDQAIIARDIVPSGVTAEDRSLLLEQARYNSIVAASTSPV